LFVERHDKKLTAIGYRIQVLQPMGTTIAALSSIYRLDMALTLEEGFLNFWHILYIDLFSLTPTALRTYSILVRSATRSF
jgi:hypothetical protein